MEDFILLKNPNTDFIISFILIYGFFYFYFKIFTTFFKEKIDFYFIYICSMLFVNFCPGFLNLFVSNHTIVLGVFELGFLSVLIYKIFFVKFNIR